MPTRPPNPDFVSVRVRTFLAIPVLVLAVACSGGDGGTTEPDVDGTVTGQVAADGTGVPGATLTLTRGSTNRTTNSTGSGSYTFTGVAAGSWDVAIAVPAGFTLATGQSATMPVTVTAGQTSTVNFALTAQPGGGSVVEVELSGMSFVPSDVTVGVGTTVRWIYRNGGPHTVTPDGHSTWDAAMLTEPSQVFEHTFTAAGTFTYYCDPHRASGMTGVIRVQ